MALRSAVESAGFDLRLLGGLRSAPGLGGHLVSLLAEIRNLRRRLVRSRVRTGHQDQGDNSGNRGKSWLERGLFFALILGIAHISAIFTGNLQSWIFFKLGIPVFVSELWIG